MIRLVQITLALAVLAIAGCSRRSEPTHKPTRATPSAPAPVAQEARPAANDSTANPKPESKDKVVVRNLIPDQFLGRWSTEEGTCAQMDADITTLVLTSSKITFWESGGPVVAMATRGESELVLIVDWSDEDEAYLRGIRLVLSEDGKQLSVMNGLNATATRVKCSATAAGATPGNDKPIPPEAQAVIDRVRNAALSRDYETLRKNMSNSIALYFGSEDGNADQVLEAWRKEPEYFLKPMPDVLRACRLDAHLEVPTVDCDLPEDESFRARFQVSEGAWKLMYFVNGD